MILAIKHTNPGSNSHPLISLPTTIHLSTLHQHSKYQKERHLVRTWSQESTTQGPEKGDVKGYEYIPILIAKILKRMEDVDCVTRNVFLSESDPAIIGQTIAHIFFLGGGANSNNTRNACMQNPLTFIFLFILQYFI